MINAPASLWINQMVAQPGTHMSSGVWDKSPIKSISLLTNSELAGWPATRGTTPAKDGELCAGWMIEYPERGYRSSMFLSPLTAPKGEVAQGLRLRVTSKLRWVRIVQRLAVPPEQLTRQHVRLLVSGLRRVGDDGGLLLDWVALLTQEKSGHRELVQSLFSRSPVPPSDQQLEREVQLKNFETSNPILLGVQFTGGPGTIDMASIELLSLGRKDAAASPPAKSVSRPRNGETRPAPDSAAAPDAAPATAAAPAAAPPATAPRAAALPPTAVPPAAAPAAPPSAAAAGQAPPQQVRMAALGLFAALSRQEMSNVMKIVLEGRGAIVPAPTTAQDILDHRCLDEALYGGALRFEDVWLTDDQTLFCRMSSADPKKPETSARADITLQAFQADPLREVVKIGSMAAPPGGAALLQARLANPYAPVLLLAHGGAGEVVDATILPFPSLCRGGGHAGELALLGAGVDRLQELRCLSDMLLQDALGLGLGTAAPSLTAITVSVARATGKERFFSLGFQSWLQNMVGVRARLSEDDAAIPDALREQLAANLEPSPAPAGARERLLRREAEGCAALYIPADALPSLSVLFSRRLPEPGPAGWMGGSVILAEAQSSQPVWAITVPTQDAMLARLQPLDSISPAALIPANAVARPMAVIEGTGATGMSPVPLAVRFVPGREPHEAARVFSSAPDGGQPLFRATLSAHERARDSISVLLPAQISAVETVAFLTTLRMQSLSDACQILALNHASDPERHAGLTAALQSKFPGQFTLLDHAGLNPSAALNAAAVQARGRHLLVAGEPVLLNDPRTLEALMTLMLNPRAASVSCACVTETEGKSRGVLRQHIGGLFPARIALTSLPNLVFEEPSGSLPLPPATYPVAANPFRLALVRAEAWHSLGGLEARGLPNAGADLDFALRALRAGWRHLCTTAVTVTLPRASTSRRVTDPVGTAFMPLAQWQDIANEVTLVQALR